MFGDGPMDGTLSTAMAEDGPSAFSLNDGGNDKRAENPEDAHEHADPSKGDKEAEGGGRVKTDDHKPSSGAADEQASMFKRSI